MIDEIFKLCEEALTPLGHEWSLRIDRRSDGIVTDRVVITVTVQADERYGLKLLVRPGDDDVRFLKLARHRVEQLARKVSS